MYKPYIIFVLLIVLGIAVLFLISAGYYPVAMVNGQIISARTFLKNYEAASLYYGNAVKTYRPILESSSSLTTVQLQMSILDQLIENALIDVEVKKELGADFEYLLSNKMNSLTTDQELPRAVKTIYGLDMEEFKSEILAPQAEREILMGRLFLRGEKIDNWLANAKKNSSVRIFSSRLYWGGEEVKARE